MLLERPELLGPERFDLVEPGLQRDERLRAQSIHPEASVFVDELGLDEPALTQHPQVTAHRGTAHADARGQLACPLRPGSEKVDDRPPGRIRKRRERHVDRSKIIRHYTNR